MNDVDVKLLEKSFKRYYLSHISEIPIPTEITKREFGYKKFTGGMIRHIAIRDEKALRLLLVENSPADVYCSRILACGIFYECPQLPACQYMPQEYSGRF